MAKSNKPFILNDETVENSYGFYVSTDGIKLGRFEKNPVMLSDHNNSNRSVLGRWSDWKKEKGILTAYPEFDTEDPEAALVEGKVERDFIKGASMGLLFSYEDMVILEGKVWLKESELVEGTIIPVPSNSNALRLYLKGKEDTPLTEDEIKSLCLSLNGETKPEKIKAETNMSTKISLGVRVLIALGLKDAPDGGMEKAEIESHILALSAKVETAEQKVKDLEAENTQLKDAAKTASLSAATKMVDEAIEAGKITADKKEAFLALANTDIDTLKAALDAIPAKTSLAAKTAANGTTKTDVSEVKTHEDFQNLSTEAQLSFKTDHPEQYKKLFNTK